MGWLERRSMADELVEVTLHGINHGYPWRAAVEPAARVLEAGLDWLADQVDVDDVEEPAYEGEEDADGAGEFPVEDWALAGDEEIVRGEPFTDVEETVPGGGVSSTDGDAA